MARQTSSGTIALAGTTSAPGPTILWLSDGVAPDLIISVTTGVGANVTVAYKSMTDGGVYTKGSTARLVHSWTCRGPRPWFRGRCRQRASAAS